MQKPKTTQLRCFIGMKYNSTIDQYLDGMGFTHSLVLFSIPDLGIIFRCRASGKPLDLEFAAFFSLLKFINMNLVKGVANDIMVCSSNPEFVFSFMPGSHHLSSGSVREKLLKDYSKDIKIQVSYIEKHKNYSLISSDEFPSLPVDYKTIMKTSIKFDGNGGMKPFQKGIDL
jgi:hypothetical protein